MSPTPPSAWQSLMHKAVAAGVVTESLLRLDQLAIDESHVIAQDVAAEKHANETAAFNSLAIFTTLMCFDLTAS